MLRLLRAFSGFAVLLLVGGLGLVVTTTPASATSTLLCTSYAGCAKAGMSNAGYSAANRTMYWQMYSGHNCTNYVAYRMVQSGLPNTRPWSGDGNASNWGPSNPAITNSVPAVGAVAWWAANVRPAGSAGHVAYVEQVISPDEIVVSQDSWGGDFSWARITRTSSGWPSGFVHAHDVPLLNTVATTISGTAKVGSVLTASPGRWNPADATLRYQWRADGVNITGATSPTLTLALAQQGKKITIQVTASKLGYPTASVVSAATAAVQPGVLTNTLAPVVTGEPTVDSVLTAGPGQWNPVLDSVRYQWRADGAPVQGATTPSLTVTPSLVGKALSVTVTAIKSGYAAVAVASAATKPVAPGTLTVTDPPSVIGVPQPGQTLTLVQAGVTPQAAGEVQWLRAGVPVPGATGATYRLSAADLGSRVAAGVRLTRDGYNTATTLAPATPQVRSTPTIRVTTQAGTGRLVVNATVTAAGVSPVTGVIRVRSRGAVLKEVPLRNGAARTTVTGLPRGTWTFRFRFPTTSTVSRSTVERRIRIG